MVTTRPKAHIHTATVQWSRGDAAFTDNRFSRAHEWRFDGGIVVPASSAPSSIRLPFSIEDAVDPEEALVAALSSCHMMTFLYLAAQEGLCIDAYRDDAIGAMTPNAAGKLWVSQVTLVPKITFSGEKKPTAADVARLHHAAHEACYIANSVRTDVLVAKVEPVLV